MKVGGLYHVTWRDARGVDAAWGDPPTAPDLCLCESVGWLVAKDRTGIALAPHRAHVDRGTTHVCGTMHIPRSCIVEARELDGARS
jgi:hypothetical protein